MSQQASSSSNVHDQTATNVIEHCYSGGCEGTDYEWTKTFGKQCIIYSFDGHHQRILPNVGEVVKTLNKNELSLADQKLSEANKYLKRKNIKINLLRRNYYIISKADACYAIIEEFDNKREGNKDSVRIKRGTAWGCQMFLLKYISENQIKDVKKAQPHLYVFCQKEGICKWFGVTMDVKGGKIINIDWSERNPKSLSGNFAGIGIRGINDQGKQAIHALAHDVSYVPPRSSNRTQQLLFRNPYPKVVKPQAKSTTEIIDVDDDLTTPTTITSGQTFTPSARLVENGNTVITSGSVVLSWEGSGTLTGSTVASFSNGVASFSVSITVSSATSGMLKATYTSGGSTYSQSIGVSVQTGSNNDYTSAWVGTWKIQDTCDVNSCYCLTGSVTVTKSNTNAVLITSPCKRYFDLNGMIDSFFQLL